MTTQYYIRTHPALDTREIRIRGQASDARAAQARTETSLRNVSFAATAAAHTSAPVKTTLAKPVNPHLGRNLDIKV